MDTTKNLIRNFCKQEYDPENENIIVQDAMSSISVLHKSFSKYKMLSKIKILQCLCKKDYKSIKLILNNKLEVEFIFFFV